MMGKPIPGPFGFKYHPWLREMHDSLAYKNVGQKSAQMGFTEWALNRSFFMIDIRRTDCLYVLPNKSPDASDFSSARFDAALELSPHLANLFSDTKNVGHKRAGSVNMYIRGSRSRGGLKSVPVGHMTLDEYDEMDEAQVVLAIERMSGQFEKSIDILSTPTIPEKRINAEFLASTQEHFQFKCPSCSRFIELTYPECFVMIGEELTDPRLHESYNCCPRCRQKLSHENKWEYLESGLWVPAAPKADPDVRGFYVNQLYSSTIRPVDLAKAAIKAELDPTDESEFFNSKLGLPHIVKGAQITDVDINNCIGNYEQTASGSGLVTMGVDVGNFLHVEIDQWDVNPGPDINTHAKCRVLAFRKLRNFEELDALMRQYQVHACVVDKFPEQRKAKEFADRFFGYVKLCFYGRGQSNRSLSVRDDEDDIVVDHQVTVDRTSWLDVSLGRFRNTTITLPRNTPEEYKSHLKNQVRIYRKDAFGNPIGSYESTGADHFGHARNYAEIALPFAAAIRTGSDVESFL